MCALNTGNSSSALPEAFACLRFQWDGRLNKVAGMEDLNTRCINAEIFEILQIHFCDQSRIFSLRFIDLYHSKAEVGIILTRNHDDCKDR